MAFGFGTDEFGQAPFGRADVLRAGVWDRPVPFRNKDEDVTGHLEDTLMTVADLLDPTLMLIDELPQQRSPKYARSGIEAAQTVFVDTVEQIKSSVVRVHVIEDDIEKLFPVFPRSRRDEDGRLRNDGWLAAVGGFLEPIVAVDSHAGTIDVLTSSDLSSFSGGETAFEIRPPDLLARLGDNFGVLVDRSDPPDYTRRALYRHWLLRAWKVSARLFKLLGRLYGFDVSVEAMFCVKGETLIDLQQSASASVFELPEGSGQYFTTEKPFALRYDEIPADVVEVDTNEEVSFDVTVDSTEEAGDGLTETSSYCQANINPATEELGYVLELGHWKIRDTDGVEHYIEEIDTDAGWVRFYAQSPCPDPGVWQLVLPPRLQCREDWRPAAAYLIEAEPTDVLSEPLADLDKLFDRIETKLRRYIPIHIRVIGLTIERNITIDGGFLDGVELNATTIVEDFPVINDINGTLYDETAADVQPTDVGVLLVSSEFLVEE